MNGLPPKLLARKQRFNHLRRRISFVTLVCLGQAGLEGVRQGLQAILPVANGVQARLADMGSLAIAPGHHFGKTASAKGAALVEETSRAVRGLHGRIATGCSLGRVGETANLPEFLLQDRVAQGGASVLDFEEFLVGCVDVVGIVTGGGGAHSLN